MTEDEGNGWPEYRNMILMELQRFHDKASSIESRVGGLENKVVTLETRMATIAAFIGIGLAVLNVVLKFWP